MKPTSQQDPAAAEVRLNFRRNAGLLPGALLGANRFTPGRISALRLAVALLVGGSASAADRFTTGDFRWTAGEPILSAAERTDDPCYSVKDPSIVRHDGRWHLFSTIRSAKRTHQIEYISFADWKDANTAPPPSAHVEQRQVLAGGDEAR